MHSTSSKSFSSRVEDLIRQRVFKRRKLAREIIAIVANIVCASISSICFSLQIFVHAHCAPRDRSIDARRRACKNLKRLRTRSTFQIGSWTGAMEALRWDGPHAVIVKTRALAAHKKKLCEGARDRQKKPSRGIESVSNRANRAQSDSLPRQIRVSVRCSICF
jgi:hypothetical protein